MKIDITPQRHRGEPFGEYCHRRRLGNKILREYLRRGIPARASREGNGPGHLYVPGPHRSRQPHEVKIDGLRLNEHGVPVPHTWRVMHPGTLVKSRVAMPL